MSDLKPGMIKPKKEEPSMLRKAVIAGGIGTAALGAATFPAARGMLAIGARDIKRRIGPAFGIKSQRDSGAFVSDYLDSSNKALNLPGVGKAIDHLAKKGKIEQHTADHYGKFRAGPLTALKQWDWEVDSAYRAAGKNDLLAKFHAGREKAHAAIQDNIHKGLKNESESIREMGKSADKDIKNYLRNLEITKVRDQRKKYTRVAALSPAMIAGGTGVAVAASKKERK